MKKAHSQADSLPVAKNATEVTASTKTHQSQLANPLGVLRAILGNLQDGFIIASQTGDIRQINLPAERICALLNAQGSQLPFEIWRICQSALRNQSVLSSNKIGVDADITMPELGTIRVRVQNISIADEPCLLIVLEDRQQTIRNKARSDAALYGLTEREAEVWQMRLRGLAYKEISTALWISVDTVKKHVKSVLAKQRSHQYDVEYALMA